MDTPQQRCPGRHRPPKGVCFVLFQQRSRKALGFLALGCWGEGGEGSTGDPQVAARLGDTKRGGGGPE